MTTKHIVIGAIAGIVLVVAIYITTNHEAGSLDGSRIKWTDYSNGCSVAQTSNKKLLIDVYTDWCTWCKTMDKNTYADGEVTKYVNEHFVPIKLNAESQVKRSVLSASMTDEQIATAYGVTGYPTTVFAKSDGTPITSMDGYIKVGEFKTVLRYIAEDRYQTMSFEQFRSSAQ